MDTIRIAIRPYAVRVKEPAKAVRLGADPDRDAISVASGNDTRFRPYMVSARSARSSNPWAAPTAEQANELPDALYILDTETSTDDTHSMPGFEGERWDGLRQSLTFGRCQVWRRESSAPSDDAYYPYSEYLFYPDDLPDYGKERINDYVQSHSKPLGDYREYNTPIHVNGRDIYLRLHVVTQSGFLDILYTALNDNRINKRVKNLFVGFNMPFDFSRLAWKAGKARGFYAGGFTFALWSYRDESGKIHDHSFRPHLKIKHLAKQEYLFAWGRHALDSRKGVKGRRKMAYYPHNILDTAQLAFALTGEHWDLNSLAKHYLEETKNEIEGHGLLTDEYIDYNQQDVVLTGKLANRLIEEWRRHSLSKMPWELYSPASIAKAYLRAAGVQPRLQVHPPDNFPPETMGFCKTAYTGGRTEAHIRKTLLPVVYLDFTSQYPLVNCILGLWDFVVAERVEVIDATEETQRLLNDITPADCFNPATWKQFLGYALIQPDGDILPALGVYGEDYKIGLNPLTTDRSLWWAIPDLIASKLLTGKTPIIQSAFRLVAHGKQSTLKPFMLAGRIPIDPRSDDFFRVVMEERQKAKREIARREKANSHDAHLADDELATMEHALKIMLNSGSYGIFVESNRHRYAQPQQVTVYGLETHDIIANATEEPGEFFFAPIAALITSGGRLLMAMLENGVRDAGGEIAYMDTDSAQVLADQQRHRITIAGHGAAEKGPVIPQVLTALSWEEVERIRRRFDTLSPIHLDGVTALKMEDVNFDEARKQRVIYNFSISAKRYCNTIRQEPETVDDIVKVAQSGMGFYLNPVDNDRKNDELTKRVFLAAMRNELAGTIEGAKVPAVRRDTITTVTLWDTYRVLNRGKPYAGQVKPFNFLCAVQSDPFECEKMTLYTPYVKHPEDVYRQKGVNRKTGETFVLTDAVNLTRHEATLKILTQYFRLHVIHPETPYLGPDGKPCGAATRGVLGRRTIHGVDPIYIGKDSTESFRSEIEINMDDGPYDESHLVYGQSDETLKRALVALSDATARELAALLSPALGLGERVTIDQARRFKLLKPTEQVEVVKRRRLNVYKAAEGWAQTHGVTLDDYLKLRDELPHTISQAFRKMTCGSIRVIIGEVGWNRINDYRDGKITIRQAFKWKPRYDAFMAGQEKPVCVH